MKQVPISLEVLASVLGTQPGALSDALKADDENWKSQSEVDNHVKSLINDKLKSVRKDGHDEGHGRGTRESLSSVEKNIREKYNLQGDRIEDLFDEVIQKTKEKSGESTIDDDAIKQSDVFQSMVKKLNSKIEAKDEELNQIKESVRTKDLEQSLQSLAQSVLRSDKNKFVLPEDEDILTTQEKLYLSQLKQIKWKKTDDGLVPLNEKGEVMQDDSFNNVSAADLAINLAKKQFPQAKGEQRSAPNAPEGQGKGNNASDPGSKYSFPEIKTQDDIFKHLDALSQKGNVEEINAFEKHVESLQAEGALS